MKSIEDIKLEMKVSDMILNIVREAIDGKLDDMPNGDVQSTCEAVAINIINVVKGNNNAAR